MSGSTVLIISVSVALFAAFAGSLVWAQQHARPQSPAPWPALHRKRRPF